MGMDGVVLDGPRLVQLRRNQALTQKALAERSNVYFVTLRGAEHGKPVSLRTWRRLAEALGVEPLELRRDRADA